MKRGRGASVEVFCVEEGEWVIVKRRCFFIALVFDLCYNYFEVGRGEDFEQKN